MATGDLAGMELSRRVQVTFTDAEPHGVPYLALGPIPHIAAHRAPDVAIPRAGHATHYRTNNWR